MRHSWTHISALVLQGALEAEAYAVVYTGGCVHTISTLTSQGALEAEAYAAWLGGSFLLEKENDWGLALARFIRAK